MRIMNLIMLIAFVVCGVLFGVALVLSTWKGPNNFSATALPWSLFVGWVLVLLSAGFFLLGLVLMATGRIKTFWRDLYAVNLGLAVIAIAMLEVNVTQVIPLTLGIGAAVVVSALLAWTVRVHEIALAAAAVVAVVVVMVVPPIAIPVVRLAVGAFLITLPLFLLSKERQRSA